LSTLAPLRALEFYASEGASNFILQRIMGCRKRDVKNADA